MSKGTIKYYLKNIYTYFDSFWVLESNGFIPRLFIITWGRSERDLSEWSARKGDVLYRLADYYKKRVLNLTRLLNELIETSDQPLTMHIN